MRKSLPGVLCAAGVTAIVAGLWGTPTVTPAAHQVADRRSDVVRAPRSGSVTGFDVAAQLTNRDLTEQSDVIAIGQATDTRPYWADRNLFTLVTIAVSETLKGDGSGTIIVALPGGVDANRRIPIVMTYPSAPFISPDEEVFLFLTWDEEEAPGSYAIAGFAQGKFSIVPADGGAAVGLRTLGPQSPADKQVRVGDALVPLSAFKEEIRGYLQP